MRTPRSIRRLTLSTGTSSARCRRSDRARRVCQRMPAARSAGARPAQVSHTNAANTSVAAAPVDTGSHQGGGRITQALGADGRLEVLRILGRDRRTGDAQAAGVPLRHDHQQPSADAQLGRSLHLADGDGRIGDAAIPDDRGDARPIRSARLGGRIRSGAGRHPDDRLAADQHRRAIVGLGDASSLARGRAGGACAARRRARSRRSASTASTSATPTL